MLYILYALLIVALIILGYMVQTMVPCSWFLSVWAGLSVADVPAHCLAK